MLVAESIPFEVKKMNANTDKRKYNLLFINVFDSALVSLIVFLLISDTGLCIYITQIKCTECN